MNDQTINQGEIKLSNEEQRIIDLASKKPLAWHPYRIIASETKPLSALAKKGLIRFHVTQNLFKLNSCAIENHYKACQSV